MDKGEIFERLISYPEFLEMVAHVLGGSVKLSSLNARSANPQSTRRNHYTQTPAPWPMKAATGSATRFG
ncbi:MAG: hypothetical protein QM760_08605 [Nibricoccus sp.]